LVVSSFVADPCEDIVLSLRHKKAKKVTYYFFIAGKLAGSGQKF
jgi:hypothetical protein